MSCPVKHVKKDPKDSSSSSCPVKYKNSSIFNVYGQELNEANNMPTEAQQKPLANDQSQDLDTNRVQSQIPKGGTDSSTWLYPSPQMFYNALVRKNKVEGATEENISTVVAIHNNMNENTWKQILAWEALHPNTSKDIEGTEPKLLRFTGRPDELSPKARLKTWLGHPAPFDRHDWIVDRGGIEKRYIIDYYHDENAVEYDRTPAGLNDMKSVKSILLDVRPALDSFEAIHDRIVRMPMKQYLKRTTFQSLPFFASKATVIAEQSKNLQLDHQWNTIKSKCAHVKMDLDACNESGNDDCASQFMALQTCMASVICPGTAKSFIACMQKEESSEDDLSTAFNKVTSCVNDFELDTRANVIKNSLNN